MPNKHKMQKVVLTASGVIRFQENRLVTKLLDKYPGGLNKLMSEMNPDEIEDYEQLMMLIGYSVEGFCSLSTPRDETKIKAQHRAKQVAYARGYYR